MNELLKENRKILLDYYAGAYGPTLRIEVNSVLDLQIIRNIFVSLAQHKNYTINFVEVDCVYAIRINKFILRSNCKARDKRLVVHTKDNEVGINWEMPCNAWEKIVCLTQSLIDSNVSGHQYLSQEGVDDAVVELTFCE